MTAKPVAVVTGGAGGLGAAVVSRLHASDHRVISIDVDEARLADQASRFKGQDVRSVALDVADPVPLADELDDLVTDVDILVNNAGVVDLSTTSETSDDEWNRVIGVNLTGPFNMCRWAIPRMLQAGHGVIINIASVSSLRGGRAGAAYTASKFGLLGLTMNIAVTYGDKGIRCNALCPGGIDTGISAGIERSPETIAWLFRDTGKPPRMDPDAVAEAVVALTEPWSRHVNGVALPIDDGWIAY